MGEGRRQDVPLGNNPCLHDFFAWTEGSSTTRISYFLLFFKKISGSLKISLWGGGGEEPPSVLNTTPILCWFNDHGVPVLYHIKTAQYWCK